MKKQTAESFDRFMSVYPKRKGGNPRHPARTAWDRALKYADAETIIAAAEKFAFDPSTPVGTEFVPHASTWLNGRRWEAYSGVSRVEAPKQQEKPAHGALYGVGVWIKEGSEEWNEWTRFIRSLHKPTPPMDRFGGWSFPSRWPPTYSQSLH